MRYLPIDISQSKEANNLNLLIYHQFVSVVFRICEVSKLIIIFLPLYLITSFMIKHVFIKMKEVHNTSR